MFNQVSKIGQILGKSLFSASILVAFVGLAACTPDTNNPEAENQNQPGQVRDASNEQTQPVNPQTEINNNPSNPQTQPVNPEATIDNTQEKSEDIEKIKTQEEGKYPGNNPETQKVDEKQDNQGGN